MLARWFFLIGILLAGRVAETQQLALADHTINVAIFDDVQLSPDVLVHAQEEATRVFQKAGIQVLWMLCKSKGEVRPEPRCDEPGGSKRFALRIVPSAWKSNDSVFGVAFVSESGTGAYGDVFHDSVQKLHRDWGVSLARVLGHVMAHELGHLLLGSNAHSRDGIMCPKWHGNELQRASMGTLLFSREQARLMRQRLFSDP